MHLGPIAALGQSDRDLLGEVRRRQALRADLVVGGGEVRCVEIAGEPALRLRDRILPLAPPAAEALARQVPLQSGRALIPEAVSVDAWLSAHDQVRLLIEQQVVIGVLADASPAIDGLAILEAAMLQLQGSGHDLRVDRARLGHGEWMVSVVARDVADAAIEGDLIYAGVHLSHSPVGDTEACSRIFRLACRNGALTDTAEGRRVVFGRELPADWQQRLHRVITAGLSGEGLSDDTARLRRAVEEIIASPYEHLCHLVAQGLITAAEQVAIQRAFNQERDQTLYGLINAITSIAHQHRDRDDWRRAIAIERLGGEVIRGDHMPPTWQPHFV